MPVLNLENALAEIEALKKAGAKIVSTNGTFDILHVGHVEYLNRARALGDYLVVGLNSDASVKRYKGPERPLNSQEARAFVLSSLKCVDAVVVFDEDTPENLLRCLKPHVHTKGGDWVAEKLPETKVVSEWGGRVQILPFKEGFSTTGIIQKAKGKI